MAQKGKDPSPARKERCRSLELKLAVVKALIEKKAAGEELAKVYGISTSRVYTWGKIYRQKGEAGPVDARSASEKSHAKPVPERLAHEILDFSRSRRRSKRLKQ